MVHFWVCPLSLFVMRFLVALEKELLYLLLGIPPHPKKHYLPAGGKPPLHDIRPRLPKRRGHYVILTPDRNKGIKRGLWSGYG